MNYRFVLNSPNMFDNDDFWYEDLVNDIHEGKTVWAGRKNYEIGDMAFFYVGKEYRVFVAVAIVGELVEDSATYPVDGFPVTNPLREYHKLTAIEPVLPRIELQKNVPEFNKWWPKENPRARKRGSRIMEYEAGKAVEEYLAKTRNIRITG